MVRSESDSISVSRRGSILGDGDAGHTVIWVRGEHDIATKASLIVAITRAARLDDVDVLVDLSEVTFMDVSTIAALVGCRNRLRSRSQGLAVRAPSLSARRVLELCDLTDLVQPATVGATHPSGAAAALSTWVDVPSRRAGPETAGEPAPSEQRQPAGSLPAAEDPPRRATAAIAGDRGGP